MVERYRREGAVFPIRAFPEEEMARHLAGLEAMEAARAGRLPPAVNYKIHLLVPSLWDMVHDPRILDAVEDVLGPDILCWASSFFAKNAADPANVPWHQDATYWGLSEPTAVTAWVAFTPSTPENGGMRIVPGTHLTPLAHGDNKDRHNMLPGREEILVEVDEAEVVDVVLAPGEMSLHHLLLVHGSKPNSSGRRRVGFAIRYIAGHLRQEGPRRGTAALVRGRDHGNFELEQRPEGDFHPDAVARHSRMLRNAMANVSAAIQRDRAQGGDQGG
jgi:hypothetical protein